MPRVSRIKLFPDKHLYYLVDSNFFANRYLDYGDGDNQIDSNRIQNSRLWWQILDFQLDKGYATVFINDLCISETFKIIAKKYYQSHKFSPGKYQKIRNKIMSDLHLGIKTLISANRKIKFHNLQADRDIIVGVSRFLEIAHKNNLHRISVIDLVILSSAKYLIDFYKIDKDSIKIISGDELILRCTKRVNDIPVAIDALNPNNSPKKYFI